MAPPSSPPSAAAPSRGSSPRKRTASAKADQEASVSKRPRKGTTSGKKKKPVPAKKQQQKATNASRETKEKAAAEKPEAEVCAEEPDEEEPVTKLAAVAALPSGAVGTAGRRSRRGIRQEEEEGQRIQAGTLPNPSVVAGGQGAERGLIPSHMVCGCKERLLSVILVLHSLLNSVFFFF